jgi:hypothetical protein
MDLFTELNQYRYIALLEIGETDDWKFRILLAELKVIDKPTLVSVDKHPNEIERTLLAGTNPIEITEKSAIYEITFNDYIMYSVRNESYVHGNDYDEYEGDHFRIYSKSQFLDFLNISTFAAHDFPGPFKHYGFITSDHIVDIASVESPNCTRVDKNA